MDRRGFLGVILAAAVAPAIVRADSLMRIVPRDTVALRVPYEFQVWLESWKRQPLPEEYGGVVTFTHDIPPVREEAMRLANLHLDITEQAINRPIVAREYLWLPPDIADKSDCMPQVGWLVAKGYA